VISTTNGYALGSVTSDAEAFLETFDSRLWRGAFLERASEGWDGNVRECLVQALRSSFERSLETDSSEAARAGRILLEMEPYDADLLRQALIAHHRNGDERALKKTYKNALERFWDVGEALPATVEAFLESTRHSPSHVTEAIPGD
jgi:DNA-binding SARP family transcriptional activator